MKKVLFVIPTMRMGGAEQSLVSLLNMLDKSKYEIDLLLFEKKGELLGNISSRINVLKTDLVTTAMVLEFRYYFKQLLKEKKFGAAFVRLFILLLSSIQRKLKINKILSWNIAKHFIKSHKKEYDVAIGYLEGVADFYVIDKVNAKKKIGWIHSDFSKQIRNLKAEAKYYEEFDKIAVISDICRKNFVQCYPRLENRALVIENMSNYEWIQEQSLKTIPDRIEEDMFYIVSVGRLEEVKGFDLAISAAAILKQKGKHFIWHILGDGSQRANLQNQIESHEISDLISLKGTTNNPYMYMRRADMIVQSSRYEGKSIVLDEAKFLGKPIVVTNYPSAKDQITNEKTGIVVEMSAEGIAGGIELLMNDEALRNKIGKNCLECNQLEQSSLKKVEALLDEN